MGCILETWIRSMRRLIVLLTSLLTTPALASEDDAKLARTAWSAWQCHQFAFYAKDAAESERFFNLGLNAARTFVTKLHAGQITRDETFKHAPIAVMFVAQGPSVDFVVGRIYSAVAQDTFDSMAKKDSSGAAMPSEKWITDTSLLKSIAESKYRDANCDLIK